MRVLCYLTNYAYNEIASYGMKSKRKSDIEMYRLPDGGGIYKIIFITRTAAVAFGRINNIYEIRSCA